jgi:hypothetical protein
MRSKQWREGGLSRRLLLLYAHQPIIDLDTPP